MGLGERFVKIKLNRKFLSAAFLFLRTSAFAADEQPKIVNLGTDFQKYWSEVKRQKVEKHNIPRHADLFKKFVIKEDEAFYRNVLFNRRKKDEAFDDLLLDALKKSVPIFYAYEDQIGENIDRFEERVRVQLSRFKEKVPDFNLGVPIYGMASLNKFEGGTRNHDGQMIMALSVDKMAARGADFELVFCHEAFHIIQGQLNPNYQKDYKETKDRFLADMFYEGLASFSEIYLNPEKKEERAKAGLFAWCKKENCLKVVNEFLADNEKQATASEEEFSKLRKKWFSTSREGDFAFPTEVAYCIGEQVVAELAKKHSLFKMAEWKASKAISESKKILQKWDGK